MKTNTLRLLSSLPALALVPTLLHSCGGGGGGAGGSSSQMKLVEAGNGFGVLLPYQVNQLDAAGQPTAGVISIRSLDDLLDNVTATNPIHPVVQWPTTASLPDGAAGNQLVFARFQQPLEAESILTGAAGAPSHLTGTILATFVLPGSGEPQQIAGRAFVGGQTMSLGPDATGQHVLQTWVRMAGGKPVAVLDVDGDGIADFAEGQQPGLGFPGTETGGFAGVADLLDKRTFVFVPDADGDLSTHETFPAGAQINLTVTTGVKAKNGNFLASPALASSTVGPDVVPPAVSQGSGLVQIVPGNGDVDVDPQTTVAVRFTEPIQPFTVGDLPDGTAPGLSPAILLQFGPDTSLVQLPFHVHVPSVLDLSQVVLEPVYAFPGSGPDVASCGTFSDVDVVVNAATYEDLAANRNADALVTTFTTGEGPGLVNAPVTPDAVFVGRGGATQSLSVIDLNGFGQSTGNPAFDATCVHKEGHTNFPNNPNQLFLAPFLIPPLKQGGCTVDGGSAGVFTLTEDTSLDDRLLRSPLVQSVGDMMLGHALDTTFNNGSPFGCQSDPGNQCAITARKSITVTTGAATFTLVGFENIMQFAPHPNPPPLRFPPLCVDPFIGGEEPTSVDTFFVNGVSNLLLPGIPFGSGCIPPQGLLSSTPTILPTWGGPSQPTTTPPVCNPYQLRQQVGNYLYMIDRVAGQVVVLNSNRMTVLERFQLPDPTELAMSPNLDFLAVTNQAADSVTFIDIDPGSSSFHQIVRTTVVGDGPTGIAWEPGNEDILVCNTGGGSVSILSAFNLQVRKTVSAFLSSPFDVAITPRQLGFGFQRGVYFAYVLDMDGSVAVFESGPDGVNGWGFDDIIGELPMTFSSPKAIQPDPTNFNSAVWVVHERKLGLDGQTTGLDGGAVTNVGIVSGFIGIIPLDPGFFVDPTIRDLEFGVLSAIGKDQLTGVPTDIAFDNWTNFTTFPNYSTDFSAGTPVQPNAKGILLTVPGGGLSAATVPQYMFLAVPNSTEGPGVVDVIRIAGALREDTDPFTPGTQSIPAPGANTVMDYFRQ